MIVLAPLWLVAAAAAGAAVVIAHLMSTDAPPERELPTARFVPATERATAVRRRRLSDVALLVLRLAIVAALGLAMAGIRPPARAPGNVVLVDVSRATASMGEAAAAAAPYARGAAVIAFDSSARRVDADSIAVLPRSGARGSLSAALVAAHRAIGEATTGREQSQLVIVSPAVREEIDSAATVLLSSWPGTIRHVSVRAAVADAYEWQVTGPADDPVRAALSRFASGKPASAVARIVRGRPTAADSAWARDSGRALVLWPVDPSRILAARADADSSAGFAAGDATVIGAFVRRYTPRGGRVVARWLDGEPAATEAALGAGCVREVAIPVDAIGDLSLRASFAQVARGVAEPCGGARDFTDAANAIPSAGHTDEAFRAAAAPSKSWVLALALVALAALVAEQWLRRRREENA